MPEIDNANPLSALADKPVVLIGLMGAGKTSVGKKLAALLGREFVDSDHEIEAAAGLTIPEIFEKFGESHFRQGEARVIERLMGTGPIVLATGGGAFISEPAREVILREGISVWLKAEVSTLWGRVKSKPGRPLLQNPDPLGVLTQLAQERYPIYAQADFTVDSHAYDSTDDVAARILKAITQEPIS